jgi:hypothetical protein
MSGSSALKRAPWTSRCELHNGIWGEMYVYNLCAYKCVWRPAWSMKSIFSRHPDFRGDCRKKHGFTVVTHLRNWPNMRQYIANEVLSIYWTTKCPPAIRLVLKVANLQYIAKGADCTRNYMYNVRRFIVFRLIWGKGYDFQLQTPNSNEMIRRIENVISFHWQLPSESESWNEWSRGRCTNPEHINYHIYTRRWCNHLSTFMCHYSRWNMPQSVIIVVELTLAAFEDRCPVCRALKQASVKEITSEIVC